MPTWDTISPHLVPVLCQLAVFLVSIGIIRRQILDPFTNSHQGREKRVSDARATADREATLAAEQRAAYEARLASAREHAEARRQEIRGAAQAHERRVLGDALDATEERLAQSRDELASQVKAARTALAAEARNMARDMAARVLGTGSMKERERVVIVHGSRLAGAALAIWGLLPVVARAAEEAEEHHANFVWYIVNFGVLLWALWNFGRKPIKTFLVERKETALAELRAAERLRDEARAKLAALEERLSRIDTEIQSILDGTLKLAESERDRIIRGAEETAERIRAQAGMMLEQEVRRARQDLAREVTDSAAREAAALLAGSVSDADQDRLVREFAAAQGRRP